MLIIYHTCIRTIAIGVPDDVPPTTSRSPTLTRCQEMRSHKQSSGFVGYRPLCTESGAFEPKQCYETTKECWCVDSEGNQLGEVFRAPVEATCPPKGSNIETCLAIDLRVESH